jgi:oligopeptide transport system ATP-binding protein
MTIIFQDSQSSFNPRMTLNDIIGRPLEVFGFAKGPEKKERVVDLLKKVEMDPDFIDRYPHELSGGQQQRVGIARALATHPKFIILDEPTSALDVSVQAQILNLLKEIQMAYGLTYLFISHNLTAVSFISHRIAIMYLGRLVEIGPAKELFQSPQHPYTQALIAAVPLADPERRQKGQVIKGDVPSPMSPPNGCRFHTRCQFKNSTCRETEPKLFDLGNGHYVACHLRGV